MNGNVLLFLHHRMYLFPVNMADKNKTYHSGKDFRNRKCPPDGRKYTRPGKNKGCRKKYDQLSQDRDNKA